jgi:hypothetical protein
VTSQDILDALKVLSRTTRDDMVRLFDEQRWPVSIRKRDAVRDLIGIAVERIEAQHQPGLPL